VETGHEGRVLILIGKVVSEENVEKLAIDGGCGLH
jgi:hypothetical protein